MTPDRPDDPKPPGFAEEASAFETEGDAVFASRWWETPKAAPALQALIDEALNDPRPAKPLDWVAFIAEMEEIIAKAAARGRERG